MKEVCLASSLIPAKISSENIEQKTLSVTTQITRKLITSAAVDVYDKNGRLIRCRAIMDTCSMVNFITERLAAKLNLPRQRAVIPVSSLNDLSTTTKYSVNVTFKSIHHAFERTLTFFTIPNISDHIPSESIGRESIKIPNGIKLADPEFYKAAPVDLLISSAPSLAMLCIGQIDLSDGREELILQKTRLGWTIGGQVENRGRNTATCFFANIQDELTKFWEVEESLPQKRLSAEENECEEHFKRNTTRDQDGRYIVALPFKREAPELGDSRRGAIKRLNALERKFSKNAKFKGEYEKIIEEYAKLGHLTEKNSSINEGFFLPHHAVVKESSATTKVRVVFDASASSSSGVSLNDILLVGPTIQDDIFSLILRFRTHRYVITADVEKMYRQFWVRDEDRKFQQILWQGKSGLQTFELNTVTFGLACAPYLAIRCLHQLAIDEGNKYPSAAKCLKNDMYVDDLLTGCDSIAEAIKLRSDLTKLLKLGGLRLRQWASNESSILQGLPSEELNHSLQLDKESSLKTLGISWNASEDLIRYSVRPIPLDVTISKRKILSEIAKIYDPLGLLGPVIFFAKLMMQRLWLLKLDWDESVPVSIHTTWTSYCEELPKICEWTYERKIFIVDAIKTQLHGFSDASEKGYGACIYVRSEDPYGNVTCNLLCSKSRVAPLKSMTLPRLELCAAHLLAKLSQQVVRTIGKRLDNIILWTDSMVTLHWINTEPYKLKTFVANRVAEIQERSDAAAWRHIKSTDNPADALSRGQTPNTFVHNSLWRHGPPWITKDETKWPKTLPITPEVIPESKKQICLINTINGEMFERFSTFGKLRRTVAYCLRFVTKIKGTLTIDELRNAETRIVKLIQTSNFKEEMHQLKQGLAVNNSSKLKCLSPFLDEEGVIRVGGRLQNSELSFAQRHPAVLPKMHHVTDLILQDHHVQNFHAGVQTTLYSIRRAYWPIDARRQVRKIISKCINCYRAKPRQSEYTMGNLPKIRVTQSKPFAHVGVDYCGPFFIKEKKHRNRGKVKVYIAIFICLVVKASHLEVVSDLSTEGFMGALRRFIARRGKPQVISSDNGTNFVGAKNELKELYATINSTAHNERVSNYLGEQGIEWRFIPPISPNFGGLWESTVKVFKHHFRRVVKNELFTFEELNTLVIEIEAILNSRPLTPLSSDPNDLLALTPGHFLIGDALTSLPFPNYDATPINRLSRWEHLLKIRQDFWARWSKEYLNELNIRTKWTTGHHRLKEGTVVLIKEDHLPPMQWSLGRITKLHPGADGITRVVTVKTSNKEYVRNIQRLAPLPIEEKEII